MSATVWNASVQSTSNRNTFLMASSASPGLPKKRNKLLSTIQSTFLAVNEEGGEGGAELSHVVERTLENDTPIFAEVHNNRDQTFDLGTMKETLHKQIGGLNLAKITQQEYLN